MGMIALALAAAFVPTPEGVEMLQPATGWNIDYAENSCTLSRSFGTGEETVSLGFIPQTGGKRMRIALISKDPKRFVSHGAARIVMGGAAPVTSHFYSLIDPRLGRVGLIRATRAELAPLEKTRTLTLDLGGRTTGFAIPHMSAGLKALAACETDLAKGWGFDLSQIETPPALTNMRELTEGAFPELALKPEMAGETGLRVAVDAAGAPTFCAVTEASGQEMLDKRACARIMARANFTPAMGKEGKPVAGLFATSWLWLQPDSPLW